MRGCGPEPSSSPCEGGPASGSRSPSLPPLLLPLPFLFFSHAASDVPKPPRPAPNATWGQPRGAAGGRAHASTARPRRRPWGRRPRDRLSAASLRRSLACRHRRYGAVGFIVMFIIGIIINHKIRSRLCPETPRRHRAISPRTALSRLSPPEPNPGSAHERNLSLQQRDPTCPRPVPPTCFRRRTAFVSAAERTRPNATAAHPTHGGARAPTRTHPGDDRGSPRARPGPVEPLRLLRARPPRAPRSLFCRPFVFSTRTRFLPCVHTQRAHPHFSRPRGHSEVRGFFIISVHSQLSVQLLAFRSLGYLFSSFLFFPFFFPLYIS